MSAVFESLSGMIRTGNKAEAYKEHFLFAESFENLSSAQHLATYDSGEWLMVESKGFVFCARRPLPEKPAIGLTKNGRWWKVVSKNVTHTVPGTLIFKEPHDNELVYVLMIPSVYDVRYRSTVVRVVALLAVSESGARMLIGVDPKRFKSAVTMDVVEYSSIWENAKLDHPQTMPRYSPMDSKPGTSPSKMTLSEAKAKWYSVYVKHPDHYVREDFDEEDVYWLNLWERINLLTHSDDGFESDEEENSSVDSTNVDKHDDFITNAKPLNVKKVKLADTRSGVATSQKKVQSEIKDLSGKVLSKDGFKPSNFGKTKLETSKELVRKQNVEQKSIYDYMLVDRRESK